MPEELDLSGIDPVFFPRLKLFLGADIVGSTAYKQPLNIQHDDPYAHAQWAGIIQGFYKSISDAFQEQRQEAINLLKGDESKVARLLGPAPRFWKTIGDEVVFWKELSNSLQIWLTLACWIKTVASVRGYFQGQNDDLARRLDIKSTAWLAGFPVRNKAILGVARTPAPKEAPVEQLPTPREFLIERLKEFYLDGDDRVVADFIGPGIDIGFRISSFASTRKMSISLDVAYALAMTRVEFAKTRLQAGLFLPSEDGMLQGSIIDRLKVHYSGSEQLKGVLGGISYPKFWISTLRSGSLEDTRISLYTSDHGQLVEWEKLEDFCEKFYDDRAEYVSRPFILGDKLLGDFPERYEKFLKAAAGLRDDNPGDFQI